jgi:hypothetical protein
MYHQANAASASTAMTAAMAIPAAAPGVMPGDEEVSVIDASLPAEESEEEPEEAVGVEGRAILLVNEGAVVTVEDDAVVAVAEPVEAELEELEVELAEDTVSRLNNSRWTGISAPCCATARLSQPDFIKLRRLPKTTDPSADCRHAIHSSAKSDSAPPAISQ